ncbi:GH116 family glycosyl hydrolase [Silvibacterium acidisoli]|uniref:GH116 family glycosyl hydrolase n=1 Tax=Acidobacteriaceae bacterium ZG23-2 TaxID=2883246 RepID=UPI00406C72DD
MKRPLVSAVFCTLVLLFTASAWAADGIPEAAWKRPLGQPFENPGHTRSHGDIDDGYWQGSPVGGFGAGTFSRTYRGDFARWHIKAANHKYETVYANQFAVFEQSEGESPTAQVLMNGHPEGKELSSWKWDYPVGAGNYYSLFPKSWFDYQSEKLPAHLTLEQYSPILPDNYKESSYPVAVYRWHADNPTNKTVTVSVLLSWNNMSGWFRTFTHDFAGTPNQGNYDEYKSEAIKDGTMKGVVFDRLRAQASPNEWDGQFAIAAIDSPGTEVTYQTTYMTEGDGSAVWAPFSKDGRLSNATKSWVSDKEKLGGAIAVRFTLKPGEHKIIPMVISWDFPTVQFGEGRKWERRYTDFYGTSGRNAWQIARDGLLHADEWSEAIDKWQAPYVNDASKPLWYRGMLFNELYVLTDGGTFWGRQQGAPKTTTPTFALLESMDYAYYGTLDVAFYATLPMLKFWPTIDKQTLNQFGETVNKEWPEQGLWVWKTEQTGEPVSHKRKVIGAVPHDFGVPEGDPFVSVNEPGIQDTNNWKDLNPKWVLMVYRDYVMTGHKDLDFLRHNYPAMKQAMQYLRQFDTGGGIPENSDYPDQTYDDWVVHGVSAYSGGLWLAASRALEETAKILGDTATATEYHNLFLKGQKTYISQLWNGEYFSYDTKSPTKDAIQADELAGQWYADLTGLGDIVPHRMQVSNMKKIFDYNVMKFNNGTMGAVNGMNPDGTVTKNSEAKEVWVGTTYGFAGILMAEGMKDEAYKTTWGIYNVIYNTKAYWFRTPEAWDTTGDFRACMYMRPAGIWALEMTPPREKKAGE